MEAALPPSPSQHLPKRRSTPLQIALGRTRCQNFPGIYRQNLPSLQTQRNCWAEHWDKERVKPLGQDQLYGQLQILTNTDSTPPPTRTLEGPRCTKILRHILRHYRQICNTQRIRGRGEQGMEWGYLKGPNQLYGQLGTCSHRRRLGQRTIPATTLVSNGLKANSRL